MEQYVLIRKVEGLANIDRTFHFFCVDSDKPGVMFNPAMLKKLTNEHLIGQSDILVIMVFNLMNSILLIIVQNSDVDRVTLDYNSITDYILTFVKDTVSETYSVYIDTENVVSIRKYKDVILPDVLEGTSHFSVCELPYSHINCP